MESQPAPHLARLSGHSAGSFILHTLCNCSKVRGLRPGREHSSLGSTAAPDREQGALKARGCGERGLEPRSTAHLQGVPEAAWQVQTSWGPSKKDLEDAARVPVHTLGRQVSCLCL